MPLRWGALAGTTGSRVTSSDPSLRTGGSRGARTPHSCHPALLLPKTQSPLVSPSSPAKIPFEKCGCRSPHTRSVVCPILRSAQATHRGGRRGHEAPLKGACARGAESHAPTAGVCSKVSACLDFPGGAVREGPPASVGEARDEIFPWVGKIPWRKKWQPSPVFLPGKSHGQRSLAGHSPWGQRESQTRLSAHARGGVFAGAEQGTEAAPCWTGPSFRMLPGRGCQR